MSSADERLRVLVEDTILVGLPGGIPELPPFTAAEAGYVLTVSPDGSVVEWQSPTFARSPIRTPIGIP